MTCIRRSLCLSLCPFLYSVFGTSLFTALEPRFSRHLSGVSEARFHSCLGAHNQYLASSRIAYDKQRQAENYAIYVCTTDIWVLRGSGIGNGPSHQQSASAHWVLLPASGLLMIYKNGFCFCPAIPLCINKIRLELICWEIRHCEGNCNASKRKTLRK